MGKRQKERELYARKKSYIQENGLSGVKPRDSWKKLEEAFNNQRKIERKKKKAERERKRYQRNREEILKKKKDSTKLRKSKKYFELLDMGYSDAEAHRMVFGRKEITFAQLKQLKNKPKNSIPQEYLKVFDLMKPEARDEFCFCLGWRDYSENLTLDEIYSYSEALANRNWELFVKSFEETILRERTYSKRKPKKERTSSGKAGMYIFFYSESIPITNSFPEDKHYNKYSFFKMDGSFAIHKLNTKVLMILIHCIMNNIVESSRWYFYDLIHDLVVRRIPWVDNLIPPVPSWR